MNERYARPGARLEPRDSMVVARGLTRDYESRGAVVHALRGVDIDVARGELLAVRGRSGSGKTTLLNLLGGLDQPTAGSVLVDGTEISGLGEAASADVRRHTIAFVFQTFGLIPILSAAENVEVPLRLVGAEPRERDDRVADLLDLVGLAERARHRPNELSGGEQQRVAIAVALANDPSVVLADEPTGELDSQTSADVFGLLRGINKALGTTIIIVTHDAFVSEQVQRTVAIRDGRTSTETLRRTEETHEGHHRVIAEEYAVLDRAGRLQLPRSHVETLDLRNRVRLRLEEDHVGIWPDRGDGGLPREGVPPANGDPLGSPHDGAPAAGSAPAVGPAGPAGSAETREVDR